MVLPVKEWVNTYTINGKSICEKVLASPTHTAIKASSYTLHEFVPTSLDRRGGFINDEPIHGWASICGKILWVNKCTINY